MSATSAAPATPSPDPAAIGLEARRVAWRVLQAVAAGAYTDLALERELRRSPLAPADRGLATELACGAIRQRALLDGWIDALGKVSAERQPPPLRWLLHLGLYQLLFTARVPASAAVSTTVEIAKRDGLARLAPVVNGLLRACLRRRQPLAAGAAPWEPLPVPADPAASLALRGSLPPWLAAGLLEWLPPEGAEAFALAANQPPALDLRVNHLRVSREQVIEALAAAGVSAEPLPGLPWGLSLGGRSGDLRSLPGYADGHWSVQDRTAQTIAPLLDPQPGERLLDACAAPGGKSTHLAELIGDAGTVVAVDRSEGRLRRLRDNARRLGLSAIEPLTADAAVPGAIGGLPFDRILLDAPCSGLGTLARHPDARWRMTPAGISELVALQRSLLEAMLPLLAPAGRLVYATCTVHPGENSALIAGFLAEHAGWRLLSQQQHWPAPQAGDGFYAAVLQSPG
ncbi:16S rRNA (cytosine(967)-C(5))-methyltransferase [Synechococcus sp. CBW1107]|uniref:16S rRNA (cytosine(967)-C(5))-methyltransferase n=1 Tax=Synechococcus sp. CBW1107 TaxID=2789857 RepID=UPI0018CF48FD|nr:16S rRNA (cytosine(967)-C(5))-methyltransferase [Synechococcus sp. CBW1107]QPN57426.1 16S rRNA (cytosine(967)-C(5))-methyltransferase [Synechococcus sp. CBW1107]CAK6692396.1 Ribosomal RNA small subunit methyltransferase B [Synechococcus sp. CBW1107]